MRAIKFYLKDTEYLPGQDGSYPWLAKQLYRDLCCVKAQREEAQKINFDAIDLIP